MRFAFRDKGFFRKTACLMVPVVLQQLITIGINFLDTVMVGSFGEVQIDAAAFSNQFYSLFQFICMGLGSGAVVMSAQFWGRKELEPMRTVAAIALRLTVCLCGGFTLAAVLFPQVVLGIFTNDPAILAAGAPYMRLVGLTFLPAGLASTATYLMRSIGRVNIPLIGSGIAFFLNFFFNWVFIFGKFGAPRLELLGAAVGTLIARLFEFAFVFGYFLFRERDFAFRLRHFLLRGGFLWRQYLHFSVPVLISDTLLGVSLSLVSVIYGHVGQEIAAANSMINSLVQVITVLNMGMGGASSIVIGNTIGEGDLGRAKGQGNTYVLLAFLAGLALIPVLLLLEGPYLSLFQIAPITGAIAHGMLLVSCAFLPIQTVAYVISKGILRGGGDSRFLLLADSSMVWLVSLPLGLLAAFLWKLDPVWVYFFLRMEYPLKGILCFIRFCTGRWIKVIRGTEGVQTPTKG